MSQAKNKVFWCINKARRELAEKQKHRGLVEIKSDDNNARQHILKAQHNLSAALFFAKHGYSDWSASGFFYCIYHCFLGILHKYGYESRNQECTIAVIEMLNEEGRISIDSKIVDTLKAVPNQEEETVINIRENLQYGTDIAFDKKEEFERLTRLCKEAIEEASRVIYK